MAAEIREPAGDADTLSPHVGDWDDQPEESSEEGDDVTRSPFGEHQRSVQPEDKDRHGREVCERSRLYPADDVGRQVKGKEEDREKRGDGQHYALFHFVVSFAPLISSHNRNANSPTRAGKVIVSTRLE